LRHLIRRPTEPLFTPRVGIDEQRDLSRSREEAPVDVDVVFAEEVARASVTPVPTNDALRHVLGQVSMDALPFRRTEAHPSARVARVKCRDDRCDDYRGTVPTVVSYENATYITIRVNEHMALDRLTHPDPEPDSRYDQVRVMTNDEIRFKPHDTVRPYTRWRSTAAPRSDLTGG
jgi:hypothetical protein